MDPAPCSTKRESDHAFGVPDRQYIGQKIFNDTLPAPTLVLPPSSARAQSIYVANTYSNPAVAPRGSTAMSAGTQDNVP
jgi:hypothetical protein